MKSIGGVAVLQSQNSLNNHPHNNRSHRAVKPNPSHTNSPSLTPNFTDRRRRTLPDQMKKRHNRTEFFAGSGFVESPPPSSVPIPAFFLKSFGAGVTDDLDLDLDRDRTVELRRVLGLSLV